MSKDISKILTKGSVKQRVILLANEIGERGYGGKGNLSDKELDELHNSFKTNEEIRLYNKFKKQEGLIRNVIGALGQIQNAYLERIAVFTGFVMLNYSYQETEEIINVVLSNIEDKNVKKKVLKVLTKQKLLYSQKIEIKDKDFISIKEEEEEGISYMMRIVRDQAKEILIQYKTILKAVRDSIEETGFKVKAYIKHIDNSETLVKNAGGKFLDKEFPEFKKLTINYCMAGGSSRSVNILLYPDYDKINIDEKLYKQYREKLI